MLKCKSEPNIRKCVSVALLTKYKVVKYPLYNKTFVQDLDGQVAMLDNNAVDRYDLNIISEVLHGIRDDHNIRWISIE